MSRLLIQGDSSSAPWGQQLSRGPPSAAGPRRLAVGESPVVDA